MTLPIPTALFALLLAGMVVGPSVSAMDSGDTGNQNITVISVCISNNSSGNGDLNCTGRAVGKTAQSCTTIQPEKNKSAGTG